jgi:hypothetical protein
VTVKESSISLALSFHQLLERELPELRDLGEQQANQRPGGSDGWTRKEELGHLLDSAVNNHMRFVLAGLGPGEFRGPGYAQDDWVALHGYQDVPWEELVELWRLNNRALARVVERIPAERLDTLCTIGSASGSGAPVTLRFVIEDYIFHMQHHLDHLLAREKITAYPSGTTTGTTKAAT